VTCNMIRVGELRIGEEEKKIINEVLESGRISEGPKVKEFEEKFSAFVGTRYSVAVSSGTAALITGLEATKIKLGVKQGQKVLTTPLTYISTSNAIVLTRLDPVYVDVDEVTFNITPENIRICLEEVRDPSQFSLILPVHLMGYPCEMNEINSIAKDYGLSVFEDSAQAHGTVYSGHKTGSLSLLADFSFYIAHNIQAGELGAITTNDREIRRLCRTIKANGRACDCDICQRSEGKCPKMKAYKGSDDFDPRFTHDVIGYNFKTMEFQAALALVQLEKADYIKRRRSEIVKYLNDGLSQYSDLLQLPKFDPDVSYLAYPLVIKKPPKLSRRKLRMSLEALGIETRPLFGCIPMQQPAYSYLKKIYRGKLPVAENIGANGFYLGCHQYLADEELDFIIQGFKKIIKNEVT
jgi:perosamine synthetase